MPRHSLIAAAVVVVGIAFVAAAYMLPSQEAGRPLDQARTAAAATANTIEFLGFRWQYVGPCDYGDMFRPSLTPHAYSDGRSEVRLLELVAPRSSGDSYKRILQTQMLVGERWVSHGPGAAWYVDGRREERGYLNGLPHGRQRVWNADGSLKLERVWTNGESP
ncbi:MAG: hypothetical protein QM775_27885 [Pirellulales bacterium]